MTSGVKCALASGSYAPSCAPIFAIFGVITTATVGLAVLTARVAHWI